MADRSFEIGLERLFAEAPAFADSDLFAGRVADRMNRGWGFRQFLISSLGMAGGLIGGAQVLGSGLASRLDTLTVATRHAFVSRLSDLADTHVLPPGLMLNGEIVWMAGALAVVAVVLALTRAIRDI
jgi:hypothetical protein